ncbi:hypothetical protein BDY21DRAFT_376610 [Lineolata rhizophorae]|uniref:Uncharacterized protein n=1 Tax=Lineolata rhizophorae TaxID=578093 RepID=A0A6A6P9V6_9PEZI|nr:hypothetical protein BDY21DRAFT_376610 [Lineolata rhizophorae]
MASPSDRTAPEATPPASSKRAKSSKGSSASSRSSAQPQLRFVTTTDPGQFRDRNIMRNNRSHVMFNHLRERQQQQQQQQQSSVLKTRTDGSRVTKTVKTKENRAAAAGEKTAAVNAPANTNTNATTTATASTSTASSTAPDASRVRSPPKKADHFRILDPGPKPAPSADLAAPLLDAADRAATCTYLMPTAWRTAPPAAADSFVTQAGLEQAERRQFRAFYPDDHSHGPYHHALVAPEAVADAVARDRPLPHPDDQARPSEYVYDLVGPGGGGPIVCLGHPVDSFRVLPHFNDYRIDVTRLKRHCNHFFSSPGLQKNWVPTLLSTRLSFLSCLALASVHWDVVHGCPVDSYETTVVKTEIVHMINETMADEVAKSSDATIMSVLHLIVAEIMGLDDEITLHELGIEQMIRLRGGLAELGTNGFIASLMTLTSFQSAMLRESTPSPMYFDFYESHLRPPEDFALPRVESPFYCPLQDFQHLYRAPNCSANTAQLLRDIRDVVRLFLDPDIGDTTCGIAQQRRLCDRILWQPSADDRDVPLALRTDHIYEAVRIAGVIIALAIRDRVPLSAVRAPWEPSSPSPARSTSSRSTSTTTSVAAAAAAAPRRSPSHHPNNTFARTPAFPGSALFSLPASGPPDEPSPPPPETDARDGSLPAALKLALLRSDLYDLWGPLAGTLYFCATVGAAAARPADADAATARPAAMRRWLAALLLRASTILVFEQGPGVLAAARTTLRLQRKLAAGPPFRARDARARARARLDSDAASTCSSAGAGAGAGLPLRFSPAPALAPDGPVGFDLGGGGAAGQVERWIGGAATGTGTPESGAGTEGGGMAAGERGEGWDVGVELVGTPTPAWERW